MCLFALTSYPYYEFPKNGPQDRPILGRDRSEEGFRSQGLCKRRVCVLLNARIRSHTVTTAGGKALTQMGRESQDCNWRWGKGLSHGPPQYGAECERTCRSGLSGFWGTLPRCPVARARPRTSSHLRGSPVQVEMEPPDSEPTCCACFKIRLISHFFFPCHLYFIVSF